MKTVLFAIDEAMRHKVFSTVDERRIQDVCRVACSQAPPAADKAFLLEHIERAHIVITSWDTAALDADVMAKARNLELLTHAAGSVRPVVTEALWERGVQVTSAAAAIAYGVAEFCLGLILMACKRAFWAGPATRKGQWKEGIQDFHGPNEIYQQTVGIIGAGHVGRHLIRLLKNCDCDILLYDPYCSRQGAGDLGVAKADTLEEIFSRCIAVSLNAPSTEETRDMIRGTHFRLLRPGAVFINTARAAIVHEQEMVEELAKGRFVACIDVTDPEPPPADSPLRSLPNVWLTPHIAGAVAQNLLRIGTFAANEVEAFLAGEPLHFQVTEQQLANMA